MPFCKNCGMKLETDAAFCPECSTPVVDSKPSQKKPEEKTDEYQTRLRGKPQSYGVLNLENLPEEHIIDERYEIKEKVGQGGFGAVYRAFDNNMNIDKALKVIPEAIVNDKEAMFNLQKEAQTMIALNHPNIVRVYDFHRTGSIKYIDMEYIDGKTLTEIKLEYPDKKVPEDKVKDYALNVAEGLAFAHSKNVIHKDIKPQNVMITKDGEVKLMDFGIAETVRTSMSRIQNTSSSGTLVYMSPEQLLGKDVGKESDIYSFGAMIYELLSGHPPFYKGDINYQILNEQPEPLSFISQNLNHLVIKCLEKDYRKRFRDFGKVLEYLERGNVQQEIVKLLSSADNYLNNGNLTKAKNKYNEVLSLDNINYEAKQGLNKIAEQRETQKQERLVRERQKNNRDYNDLVFVPGGTFQMGSNDGYSDEKPVHTVTVGDFYIGKYEVTHREYIEFLNAKGVSSNGSYGSKEYIDMDYKACAIGYRNGSFYFKGSKYADSKDCPVIEVTWYGADAYCKWKGGRLPTEAEWEFAARGGSETENAYSRQYAGSNNIDDVAWYWGNAGKKTHHVGQKQANELGIYDLSGNVWEWCNNWYDKDYYSNSPRNNPTGPSTGNYRVLRGGSWCYYGNGCRVAVRNDSNADYSTYNVGFRFAKAP